MVTSPPLTGVVIRSCTGRAGPYYVVRLDRTSRSKATDEFVTFSPEAWQGEHPAARSQLVKLYGVVKFNRGLRANQASPVSGLVEGA